MRFREKGSKIITNPIPAELVAVLQTLREGGVVDTKPESYVIPMPRRQRRAGDRDDRIIWRTVKKLGERAGVEVHPTLFGPPSLCASWRRTPARWKRSSG